jgi:predicted phosphodiesterase
VIKADVRWLHISDFHLKADDAYDHDTVLDALITSIPTLMRRFGKVDLVIASGDIAFSGKKGEYARAEAFFSKLLSAVGLGRERLFLVPGNHDIDRSLNSGLSRGPRTREEADLYFGLNKKIVHLEHRMSEFEKWHNEFFGKVRHIDLRKTYSIENVNINGVTVALALFNTASFSMDESDSGKLFVGRRCVQEAVSILNANPADLHLSVMHHPLSWLSAIESANIKALLSDNFHCILSGHLHENEIEDIRGSSGAALFFSAGATYQTRKWPNTALICTASGSEVRVTPLRYVDTPRPLWALDTALFPQAPTYEEVFPLGRLSTAVALPVPTLAMPAAAVSSASGLDAAQTQLDDRLFVTPLGKVVFAEPRLMPRTQLAALERSDDKAVSIADIVNDERSYLIEARPEYGASTLCHALQVAILRAGKKVVFRNCRNIPNYVKKLEQEFGAEIRGDGGRPTLILDDFDWDRDDRLLGELSRAGWFTRVIIISPNRRFGDTQLIDLSSVPFGPEILHLWAMGRDEIRKFAGLVLDACDPISEARAVDKVYSDLLALRIPLTPSNVLMYLRVLQREGDFEPLSRVDILEHYLAESLRKPSDVTTSSFNFKNKMDVLSSFAYQLHGQRRSEFDEREWLNFCEVYQGKTLREFDAKNFYGELIESRIFSSHRGGVCFKYEFYYTFFLGRFLWPRPVELRSFLSSENHLMHSSVIDVVTGLSSENSEIVNHLTDRLENHLSVFAQKYVRPDFDPLVKAIWPNDDEEEEKLWLPLQEAIRSGPSDAKHIDELKTSMVAEARTSNQQVTFDRFNELENALFAESWMLADALKNADDVDGDIKVRAWEAIAKSILIVFQVGTMFAPELAKRKRFNWGGISFLDFDRAAKDLDNKPHEIFVSVVTSLADAAIAKTAQEHGSVKLSAVFRSSSVNSKFSGFLQMLNFACIATARGRGWVDITTTIIEQTDKNAFYLSEMLNQLMRILQVEIMPNRDREAMKRLVALIQTKRDYGKQTPGAKAVSRMVSAMERSEFFPDPEQPEID